MKKLSITLTILVLLTLSLLSCGGEQKPASVTVYSDSVKPSIVYSKTLATNADREAYNAVEAYLRLQIPGGYLKNTDETEPFSTEIVIGKTTRSASIKAEEYLAANAPDDGDTAAYVILYHDGALALMANSETAMSFAVEYFRDNYLSEPALTVDSDHLYFHKFSLSQYYAEIEAEKDAIYEEQWAHRWDSVETAIGKTATDALKRLYDYYGTDWTGWLYNLYDPETGAFYYSNSARDYAGFLPDCESTDQALSLLYFFGLFERYDNDWLTVIPEEMRERCVAFIQSLQDKNDGYFYHPQWGKSINTSRKGRDLNQCLSLLSRMGAEPLYPTALDRLEGKSSSTSAIIATFIASQASAASHLDGEEEMLLYLDSLGINENSYRFGHTISSQTSQIVAAGLGDLVCNYIDEHQNPETGLWEAVANYQSASGVIKIASFYSSVRGAIKHGDKMLDSIIGVILSDEDASGQITYVFNPWGALSSAMSSIRKSSDLDAVSAAKDKIVSALPAMIDKTISKLHQYRHDDGSYSYYPGRSAPVTQGVSVSLGYDEGDVNGTCCATYYIVNAIFGALGVKRVSMLSLDDYREFRTAVENMSAVEKIAIDIKTPIDFEDDDISSRIDAPDGAAVVEDPTDPSNSALSFVSQSGTGTSMLVDAKHVYNSVTCFTASFDILVESADAAVTHQISLCNSSANNKKAYMIELTVGGGMVTLKDSSSEGSDSIGLDLEISEKVGRWFNLRIEYYPDGEGGANIKIYKNGICAFISQNHYGSQKSLTALTTANRLRIYAMRSPASSVLFDNFSFEASNTKTFDPSDLKPGSGAVEEPNELVGRVETFEDGMPSSFSTKSQSFSVAVAPTSTAGDNKALLLDSAQGSYDAANYSLSDGISECGAFVLEADIRIDAASTNYTNQIVLYNGGTQVYMLVIGAENGNAFVKDCVSTSGGAHGDLGVSAEFGEWFHLRVEFYPISDTEAKIKIFKNGTLTAVSTNYYANNTGATVQRTFNKIMLNSMTKPASKIYIDNLSSTFYKTAEYTED